MENRINHLFRTKSKNILSVYFTAGYPRLNDTTEIICLLEKEGADLIEIGIPFSDPTADGPIIQRSNDVALKNGMSLNLLFSQLENIREKVHIPLLLMGYVNPVYRYGFESFCRKCHDVGIDGVILPDLPPEEFISSYRPFFEENNLHNILLITPQTPDERILKIDSLSAGFIYMVSSASTTGSVRGVTEMHLDYFQRVKNLNLKNPGMIGFGISNHETFKKACQYASGAIIGSAFINSFTGRPISETIPEFVRSIIAG
jgi:tryptophan synthase alpha chain